MCGRYAFFTIKGLQDLFNISNAELGSVVPSYNIAPYSEVPAIVNNHLKSVYWQLIPSYSREFKSQFSMFNSRVESFSQNKFKEELLANNRCLIPADNYYEWQKESDTKIPYLFRKPDKSLIYFAGVYSTWRAPKSSSYRMSCSIITKKQLALSRISTLECL